MLEWVAEGRIESEIKGQVKLLLQVLTARFPSGVPADLTNFIRTTATSEKLEYWGAVVGTVTSLDEFRHIVEQNGT